MKLKSIFIVDDDPVTQLYVWHALNSTGRYKVERFNNAKACLLSLSQNPDLLLINSMFYSPDLEVQDTGLKLVKSIVERDGTLPIIILSADDKRQQIYNFISAGARNYVFKKGDYIQDLLTAIEEEFEIQNLYQNTKIG